LGFFMWFIASVNAADLPHDVGWSMYSIRYAAGNINIEITSEKPPTAKRICIAGTPTCSTI